MKHIYCKPTIIVVDMDIEEIMGVPFSKGKVVSHGSIVPGPGGDVYTREDISTDEESPAEEENQGAKGFSFDFE